MIRDPVKDPQDKIRLFLIYFLSINDVSNEDILEYTTALQTAGCETHALKYAKK